MHQALLLSGRFGADRIDAMAGKGNMMRMNHFDHLILSQLQQASSSTVTSISSNLLKLYWQGTS
jgi:hypothetical protein